MLDIGLPFLSDLFHLLMASLIEKFTQIFDNFTGSAW